MFWNRKYFKTLKNLEKKSKAIDNALDLLDKDINIEPQELLLFIYLSKCKIDVYQMYMIVYLTQ